MCAQQGTQRIVGSTPTQHGLVVEQLACGHPGKRTELYRAEQRIAEGRTRVCLRCTKAQRMQTATITCTTKRAYLSLWAAMTEARHWMGRFSIYRCRVCHRDSFPGAVSFR